MGAALLERFADDDGGAEVLSPRDIRAEQGFTMLEVVVGMILMSIVLVALSLLLTTSFSRAQKSANDQRAQAEVRDALTKIGSDIRATRASDRNKTSVTDDQKLQDALLTNAPITGPDPVTGSTVTLQVQDVLIAGPNQLRVRSDVDATAGVECVDFSFDTNTRELTRTVASWSRAGGCNMAAPISKEVVVDQVELGA